MSKISIECSERQHKEIKALAALNGKSIREYVLGCVFDADAGKLAGQVTLEAIQELEQGGGTSYQDAESMLDDILGEKH